MGLDDDLYSNVRSQILALDPLPSLNRIFSIVQQEKNQKWVMRERDHKTKAAASTVPIPAEAHNGGPINTMGRWDTKKLTVTSWWAIRWIGIREEVEAAGVEEEGVEEEDGRM